MNERSAALTLIALLLPAAVSADIRITEVMYDAAGSDAKREWIEIYNDGVVSVDLSREKLTDQKAHALNLPPKNGGVGSLTIPGGTYAVIAADATTFRASHPSVAIVIDTVLSLPNNSGRVSIGGVTMTYEKALGASGTGESLQLSGSTWIHAKPTPGAPNATRSENVTPAPVKSARAAAAVAAPTTAVKQAAVVPSSNSPAPIPTTTVPQQQAIYPWYIAAFALALGTASVVGYVTRRPDTSWEIVDESE